MRCRYSGSRAGCSASLKGCAPESCREKNTQEAVHQEVRRFGEHGHICDAALDGICRGRRNTGVRPFVTCRALYATQSQPMTQLNSSARL
jgi:hypothetical protein